MRVCFINPPLQKGLSVFDPKPPLGLAYITAYLERHGYSPRIIDMPILKMPFKQLKKSLLQIRPDVVGITCVTPTFPSALKTARLVKNVLGHVIVVMGGPHVTFTASETLKHEEVDIIVRGEGEETIVELLNAFPRQDLTGVKGISYKFENRIIHNPTRCLIEDIDGLPLPARHLLPMSEYAKAQTDTTIITSRGCPYGCIYCSSAKFWGRRIRMRSPINVVNEIEHIVNNYGFHKILFVDDTFTLDPLRVSEICDLFRARKIDVKWGCSARVDSLSKELVKKMKMAGCSSIYFGLESGNEKSLRRIKKEFTIKEAQRAVRLVKEFGIKVEASFMIGIPGEDLKMTEKTLRFAKELDLDLTDFFFFTPYPGTEIYENAGLYGITLINKDWSKYRLTLPVIGTNELSFDEIVEKIGFEDMIGGHQLFKLKSKATSKGSL